MEYKVTFRATREYAIFVNADNALDARRMVEDEEYSDRWEDLVVDEWGFEITNAEEVSA